MALLSTPPPTWRRCPTSDCCRLQRSHGTAWHLIRPSCDLQRSHGTAWHCLTSDPTILRLASNLAITSDLHDVLVRTTIVFYCCVCVCGGGILNPNRSPGLELPSAEILDLLHEEASRKLAAHCDVEKPSYTNLQCTALRQELTQYVALGSSMPPKWHPLIPYLPMLQSGTH